jgi:hypothetical protein
MHARRGPDPWHTELGVSCPREVQLVAPVAADLPALAPRST